MYDVLVEKYRLKETEAKYLADFLGKILQWEPKDRPTAQQMLNHPWLKLAPRFDTKLSRGESLEWKKLHGYKVEASKNSEDGLEELKEGEEQHTKQAQKSGEASADNNTRPEMGDGAEWESDSGSEEKDVVSM